MQTLRNLARIKTILPFFVLMLGFMGYLFPSYQAQINALAQNELTILDARQAYSVEDVQQLFEQLQPQGRAIYTYMLSRIDMLYPPTYSIFFALLLLFLLKARVPANSKWHALALLPFIALIFDYLENYSILEMLENYPQLSENQVAFSSKMTALKWLFVFTSLGSVITLTVLQLRTRLQQRRTQ